MRKWYMVFLIDKILVGNLPKMSVIIISKNLEYGKDNFSCEPYARSHFGPLVIVSILVLEVATPSIV